MGKTPVKHTLAGYIIKKTDTEGYSKGQPHTWKAGKNPYVSGRCNIALPQRTG
jgi:hypothetical protein